MQKQNSGFAGFLLPASNLGKPIAPGATLFRLEAAPSHARAMGLSLLSWHRSCMGQPSFSTTATAASRWRQGLEVQRLCGIHTATTLQMPRGAGLPGSSAEAISLQPLSSHSRERKCLFSPGVSDKFPPQLLCTAPQGHHVPKHGSPRLEENYCGPHFTDETLTSGDARAGEGAQGKHKTKQGLKRDLLNPSPAPSSQGRKKKLLSIERCCPCSAFLALQQAQGHLGQGSRMRAQQSQEKGSSQGDCSPADALPSAAVGFT